MPISICLKKSLIGASKKQLLVASSLGLKKIGDIVVQPDNKATMGKVAKIAHLLKTVK